MQDSLKHSASFCTCGHSETDHVGENFDCDPVHICTIADCECRWFTQMDRNTLIGYVRFAMGYTAITQHPPANLGQAPQFETVDQMTRREK